MTTKSYLKKKSASAPPPLSRDLAAVKIQKVFKGHSVRQQRSQNQFMMHKKQCKPGWYDSRMISKRKIIGKGGFGTVYLGINNATGQQVAIKEIITDCAFGCLNSFYTELDALRKLDHPNIVKLYGFSADSNIATLYLEYVAMGSLFTLLQLNQGRFHELFLRRTLQQVCTGVGYLHEFNLLHRDLKPHNILMDTEGVIKVTDFGCCKQLRESTTTTQQLTGTPSYMAPEAIENKVSKGSDIWGIGATFIHLASGKVPWSEIQQSSNVALIYHIGSGRGKAGHHPEIPKHISAAGKAVFKKCFAPESSDRPSCKELLETEFLSNIGVNLPDAESLIDFAKHVAETSSAEDSDMTTWISSMESQSTEESFQNFRSGMLGRMMKLQQSHLQTLNRPPGQQSEWGSSESMMSMMSNMSTNNDMSRSNMYMTQTRQTSSSGVLDSKQSSKPSVSVSSRSSKSELASKKAPPTSIRQVSKGELSKGISKPAARSKTKESPIKSKSPAASSPASSPKKKKGVGVAIKKFFGKKKSES
eukprot:TRINITY_DN22531_c0_g1_i1.p1 TRINITY_DN22531_c0_g1~~TRINITY_DN22531_c0_g1_i1.p1  ORF type:complete len:547 (+),score=79.31 TRINITY_DN22531_c0_g1_i1:49-1641(+)